MSSYCCCVLLSIVSNCENHRLQLRVIVRSGRPHLNPITKRGMFGFHFLIRFATVRRMAFPRLLQINNYAILRLPLLDNYLILLAVGGLQMLYRYVERYKNEWEYYTWFRLHHHLGGFSVKFVHYILLTAFP